MKQANNQADKKTMADDQPTSKRLKYAERKLLSIAEPCYNWINLRWTHSSIHSTFLTS